MFIAQQRAENKEKVEIEPTDDQNEEKDDQLEAHYVEIDEVNNNSSKSSNDETASEFNN